MKTKDQPLFIAFSSQKGGVGKSTFTALVASTLHYRLGYQVAVFDCDFPQHSLTKMRDRDLKTVMENEAFKRLAQKQFMTLNKKAYPIFNCRAETAIQEASHFIASSVVPPDVVFFDLPGTVNTAGILKTLMNMHYIFSPITADRVVVESTLSFTQALSDIVMKNEESNIKDIRLFWNEVDRREKSSLYDFYTNFIEGLGFSLMKSHIKDSKRFRKEGEAMESTAFRSTLLPPDLRLMKTCHLDLFMEEFLTILKLQ
ncbi:ParA family protein [Pedobacter sp. ISL-68]|uniref:ParA family protein n=1 Tax=unclassified Pedobacter TaxID=2628915 RepID=UPI001BE8883A|nr:MULTISPECIES: ParA family protein [unclassified Pedobacter]MBT2559805.1 ParA family protein [Pedobacter sp. ISL-64]MBT2592110.1 ParA family protein [Pedobacter sp. ISL-68]